MSWTADTDLSGLAADERAALEALPRAHLPKGSPVFHPGDSAQGFPIVLSGRVDVFLIGPTGRDILLYSVSPGQSCVQTTLGLLGGEPYSGEAIAATDCDLVLVPRDVFRRLMDGSGAFRGFVFRAFADRMQSTMHVLEKVAFQKVEARLAETLLTLAEGAEVHATQAELASRIGTAREVVSRRLDSFARRGWVQVERGHIHLRNIPALTGLAENADAM